MILTGSPEGLREILKRAYQEGSRRRLTVVTESNHSYIGWVAGLGFDWVTLSDGGTTEFLMLDDLKTVSHE